MTTYTEIDPITGKPCTGLMNDSQWLVTQGNLLTRVRPMVCAKAFELSEAEGATNRVVGAARKLAMLEFIGRCQWTVDIALTRLIDSTQPNTARLMGKLVTEGLVRSEPVSNKPYRKVTILTRKGLDVLEANGIEGLKIISFSDIKHDTAPHDIMTHLIVAQAFNKNPHIPFAFDHDVRGLKLYKVPDLILDRRAIEIQNGTPDNPKLRDALGKNALTIGDREDTYLKDTTFFMRSPTARKRFIKMLTGGITSVPNPRKSFQNVSVQPQRVHVVGFHELFEKLRLREYDHPTLSESQARKAQKETKEDYDKLTIKKKGIMAEKAIVLWFGNL